MMTHKTAPPTMMAVLILRALVGASSRRNHAIQSESMGRASRNVALMDLFPRTFDDRDRRRAHPEKVGIRILNLDANWESLRDADPVQFALHVRHAGGRQIDLALGLNRPSDSLHLP